MKPKSKRAEDILDFLIQIKGVMEEVLEALKKRQIPWHIRVCNNAQNKHNYVNMLSQHRFRTPARSEVDWSRRTCTDYQW